MLVRKMINQPKKPSKPAHYAENGYLCLHCGPHPHFCGICGRTCHHYATHCPYTTTDMRMVCDLCLVERNVALFPTRDVIEFQWMDDIDEPATR